MTKKINYKELFEAGVNELHFEKIRAEYLLSIMNEIESFTDDPLVKTAIKNAKERHRLDFLIHARIIFKP